MIKINAVERHLFFEGILLKYGYDFRQYAEASLDRRLQNLLSQHQTESLMDLLKMIMESPETFRKILGFLTINTTEFFRDPTFYRALRELVFPVLKTYSKISVWSAGCSTGEEVISLAIALKEEGLDRRTTIYATDINPNVLKTAKDGIYDVSCIPLFNKNYSLSGGSKSPSEYYSAEYGLVRFDRKLIENAVFSEHNLATDAAFLEANLILCRNVFIYFTRELQGRALELFQRSLVNKGYLALGSKESIRFLELGKSFGDVSRSENIYVLNSLVRSRGVESLGEFKR